MLPAYSKFCSIIRTPVYAVFRSFGLSHNHALHELLLFCQCLRQNGVHHFLLTQLSASLNLNPLGTQNSNKIISGNNTNHMLCGFPHSNKIHSSHQITQISYGLSPSYSPLFSGTGWRCCWSEGRAHCGSPPGCGRRTRSSSVLTGAGAGSWQLRWSAWSPRQGCRSGLREGSGGSPAETKRQILNFSE